MFIWRLESLNFEAENGAFQRLEAPKLKGGI